MSDRCPRTEALLDAMASAAPGDAIWDHIGECDDCARAVARALLAADPPDEDDIALAAAGLADEATAARIERARGLDPDAAARWATLGVERPSPRPSALWTLALAAGALLAVAIGAALLARDPDPRPGPPLIARGPAAEAEVEVVIGSGRVCRTSSPGAAPCVWRPATEALGVHYRAPGPVYAAVVLHDADGDSTLLHPEGGGAAPLGACTGRFCPIVGGDFDVPPGPARLAVQFFDAPPPPDAPPVPTTVHHFDLRVE